MKFKESSVITTITGVACAALVTSAFVSQDEAAGENTEAEAVEMENQEAVEDTAETETADALPADHPALGGDADAGRRVFTRCLSCHSVKEGQNKVGPSLYGVVGREAGSIEGFKYSDANANSGIVWTEDVLFEYLEDPRGYIPGTRMIFPGLPKEDDRRNVIAYLKSVAEE